MNYKLNNCHLYFPVLHFADKPPSTLYSPPSTLYSPLSTLYSLLLFLPLLFLFSCEEEIDLRLPPVDARLVVDGLITNEYTRHIVKLSLSDNYDLEEPHPMVSGASVSISDGDQLFPLTETGPGVYKTDSMSGTVGKIYQLEVLWEGKLYTAKDSLTEVTAPDAPSITLFENRFEFEFRRHLFGFSEANRWALNVLPDTTPPNFDSTRFGQQIGIKVFSDGRREFNYFTHPSIEVNGLLNFEEGHFYGFFKGATLILKKYSLSDAHYQFLLAVFQETEWRGTLFDVIPANVSSNVSGNALGFFGASAVKEVRVRVE